MEIWKTAFGHPVLEVSSHGRVRRRLPGGSNARVGLEYKLHNDTHGYPFVHYSYRGKCQAKKVHTLVAETFICPRPNGHHVNHKNGVRTDNRVENLEWLTPAENNRHARRELGHIGVRGSKNCNSKMTPEAIAYVRDVYVPYHKEFGMVPLAQKFGLHKSTLYLILKGKTYAHQ